MSDISMARPGARANRPTPEAREAAASWSTNASQNSQVPPMNSGENSHNQLEDSGVGESVNSDEQGANASSNSESHLPARVSHSVLPELQRRAEGTSDRGIRLRLGWSYSGKQNPPAPPSFGAGSYAAHQAMLHDSALEDEIIDPQVTAQIISSEAAQISSVWRTSKKACAAASVVALVAGFGLMIAPSLVASGIAFAAVAIASVFGLVGFAQTGKHPKLLTTNPALFLIPSVVASGIAATVGFAATPLSLLFEGAIAGFFFWLSRQSQREVKAVREVARVRIEDGHQRQEEVKARAIQRRAQAEERIHEAQENFKRELELWQNAKTWHPVRMKAGGSRLDVVGGTPMGWSAMLLTTCGDILQAGGQVTVIDLSEIAVAEELVHLTDAFDLDTEVMNLPQDLPRVDLGETLDHAALIDILTNVVHDADSNARREDWAANAAIIERIVDELGERATPARVIAGLRVILREEAPPTSDAGLLTFDEYEALSSLYGDKVRSAGVDQKCYNLLNQLQGLSKLGLRAEPSKGAALRVVSLDPTGTDFGNAVLGDFITHACIRQLRTAGFDHGFESSIVIVGADKLNIRNLDQISRYADKQGVGLVLMFQKLTEEVNGFIGSGDSAIAFMRMGNAKEAKFASEQIGQAPRFTMSQITENVSTSVTDTIGSSYTVTDGTSSNWSDGTSDNFSISDSKNYGDGGGLSKKSAGSGDSTSDSFGTSKNFSRGLSVSTAWGDNTSRAVGDTTGESRTLQRSKENLVEIHELQTLPQTAFVLVDMNTGGAEPRILLGDANPGITMLDSVAEHEFDVEVEDDSLMPAAPMALPNADEHKYKYAEAFVVRDPVVRDGNVRNARPQNPGNRPR